MSSGGSFEKNSFFENPVVNMLRLSVFLLDSFIKNFNLLPGTLVESLLMFTSEPKVLP